VLTNEDEKYYEKYFDLFLHPGWKQLVTDLNESLNSYRIEDIENESSLNRVKGERIILHRLVNFEESMKETYDMILESENAETL
jgi:predicted ATP-binding protein involved in virulence